jgi:hypothetical protein
MRFLSVVVVLVFAFSSCEKKEKEKEITMPRGEGQFEKNEIKIEEKMQSGDTVAMPYTVLKSYLPSTISGYKEVEVTGKEVNDYGMSWSDTKKKYTQGSQTVFITLSDYNGAYGLYAGASMVIGLPNVSNEEETSESFILNDGDIKGRQSFNNKSKEAVVILAIGERFLLNLEAQDQSSAAHLRAIAESLDLDELKKM